MFNVGCKSKGSCGATWLDLQLGLLLLIFLIFLLFPHSHSSSSLPCIEEGAKSQAGSSETATKKVCKTRSSLFSFRFAQLIV